MQTTIDQIVEETTGGFAQTMQKLKAGAPLGLTIVRLRRQVRKAKRQLADVEAMR